MANIIEAPTTVRVAMAQLNIEAGQPHQNIRRAMSLVDIGRNEGADIIVLPEMITGYMVADELTDAAYVRDCMDASRELKEYSKGVHLIWGDVVGDFRHGKPNSPQNRNNPLARGNDGRFLRYNAAYIASNQEPARTIKPLPTYNGQQIYPLEGMTIKTNMPLYNQFEDQRYMLPLKELSQRLGIPLEEFLQPFSLEVGGKPLKVGVLICEDIWVGDYFYNGKLLSPARILRDNGADLLIAVSASPSGDGKNSLRIHSANVLMNDLSQTGDGQTLPLISVNNVGEQNNGKTAYGFDGRSRAISASGKTNIEAPARQEGVTTVDMDLAKSTIFEPIPETPLTKIERRQEIHDTIVYGIREFCSRSGLSKVVIGLSGGIDSAVVASLCTEALGKDNVLAVNMPTRFNDPLTKDSAKATAEALGIEYVVVPIEDLANDVRSIIKSVSWHGDKGNYSDEIEANIEARIKIAEAARLVDENLQAKLRSPDILSNIAAKFGAVYTNNGNKSEVLQGYFTLDGDGRGFLQVIGDVFKIDVVDLAIDINLQAQNSGQEHPIPWGLILPLFDGERYYDNWDGQETPIPEGTVPIVASAELSEEQSVAKGKGDPIHFIYHDNLFSAWTKDRINIEDVAESLTTNGLSGVKQLLGLTDKAMRDTFGTYFPTPADFIKDLDKRWRNYYQATILKGVQSPPVIATSARPEGYDHRRSIGRANFTKRYGEIRNVILEQNNWASWQ